MPKETPDLWPCLGCGKEYPIILMTMPDRGPKHRPRKICKRCWKKGVRPDGQGGVKGGGLPVTPPPLLEDEELDEEENEDEPIDNERHAVGSLSEDRKDEWHRVLTEAISEMNKHGDPQGILMEQAALVWSLGVFPDGTPVKAEATRKDALRMLITGLGGKTGGMELGINFVLDAKITCADCGKPVLADPRVVDEDVDEMFGGAE